jgi:putative transposase
MAATRVRAGYRQLHLFLRREDWQINHKRIYRLYTEESLTLKRRRPRRHRSATARVCRQTPCCPNKQWAMDFMHDTLANGRSIRVLTAIDLYN